MSHLHLIKGIFMNIQKKLVTLSIVAVFGFGSSVYADKSKKIKSPKKEFSCGVSQPMIKNDSTGKIKRPKSQYSCGVSQPVSKK